MGPANGTASSGFTIRTNWPTARNFPARFAAQICRHLLGRILIADGMPGGAGHLRGEHIQAAAALDGRAACLANA